MMKSEILYNKKLSPYPLFYPALTQYKLSINERQLRLINRFVILERIQWFSTDSPQNLDSDTARSPIRPPSL